MTTEPTPRPVDPAVLATAVHGAALRGGTFGEQLDPRPGAATVLVFLRHHG